jgi:hypothetical protein
MVLHVAPAEVVFAGFLSAFWLVVNYPTPKGGGF